MYTDRYMTSAEDLVEKLDGDFSSYLPDEDLDSLADDLGVATDADLYADLDYDLEI